METKVQKEHLKSEKWGRNEVEMSGDPERHVGKLNVERQRRQNSGAEDCGFGFPVVETRGQTAAMRTHTHTHIHYHILNLLGRSKVAFRREKWCRKNYLTQLIIRLFSTTFTAQFPYALSV